MTVHQMEEQLTILDGILDINILHDDLEDLTKNQARDAPITVNLFKCKNV